MVTAALLANPHEVTVQATVAYIRTSSMPTIRRFAACKIAIYADDHVPPRFHIEGRGFRAIVEIEMLAVRAGNVRRASEAMALSKVPLGYVRGAARIA